MPLASIMTNDVSDVNAKLESAETQTLPFIAGLDPGHLVRKALLATTSFTRSRRPPPFLFD